MKKEKNNNNTSIQNQHTASHQKPKINITKTLLVGPSFWGKSYLMQATLSRRPDGVFHKITKSTPPQHSNFKIKIKE